MPCWEPKAPGSLGVVIQTATGAPATSAREYQTAAQDTCDHCGSAALTWRKCKLICDQCKQINKSCADL